MFIDLIWYPTFETNVPVNKITKFLILSKLCDILFYYEDDLIHFKFYRESKSWENVSEVFSFVGKYI